MSFLRIFICTKGENKVHIVISLEVNKSGSKWRQIFHAKPLHFPLWLKQDFFVNFCFVTKLLIKWNSFYLVYVNTEFLSKFLKKTQKNKQKHSCWVLLIFVKAVISTLEISCRRDFVTLYFCNSVTLQKFCWRNLIIGKI